MKYLTAFFVGLCTLSALSFVPAQAGLFGDKPANPPAGAPQSFADLSDRLLPAVVNISSTTKVTQPDQELPEMPEFPEGSPFNDFFKDYMDRQGGNGISPEAMPTTSLGSGFIIDAEKGLVVTNNHVVKDADEVKVILHDDTSLEAKIVGKDDKIDLAVLQVDPKKHKLTAVAFGDSDKMRVGDWVLAIGNPFGLGGTVTAGIISARKRDINAGPYDDFIQTDASINRGNSGGPMFNLNGDVIGINTAIFSPSGGSVGIGFAVPSNLAKPVIDQIIQYGRTRRGWMGVKIQTITDEIAESMGLKNVQGALVASVTPEGPADKAGIKPGDVITTFNGQKLDAMRQLPRIVAETPIDKKVPIEVLRDDKTISMSLVVGELEKAEDEGLVQADPDKPQTTSKSNEVDGTGMFVSDLNSVLRQTFEVPEDVNGVIVTKVNPTSDAALKGMTPGDLIVEVNQQKVASVDEVTAQVSKLQTEGKTSVLLLVDHQGRGDVRFVALKLTKPQAAKPQPAKPPKVESPKVEPPKAEPQKK